MGVFVVPFRVLSRKRFTAEDFAVPSLFNWAEKKSCFRLVPPWWWNKIQALSSKLLRILFKIVHDHPRPFDVGTPPPPRGIWPFPWQFIEQHKRLTRFFITECTTHYVTFFECDVPRYLTHLGCTKYWVSKIKWRKILWPDSFVTVTRNTVTDERFDKFTLNFSISLFVIRVSLSILNHSCSFMVFYYLFDVFLSL